MKTALVIVAVIGLLLTNSHATAIVRSTKSNASERETAFLLSSSTNISGAISQIVYTTPASRDFILTQVCVGLVTGGILLQIGGINVAQVGSGLCQTFDPGVILPPGQALSCTSFSADANTFCTITGLLGRPNPTPTPAP